MSCYIIYTVLFLFVISRSLQRAPIAKRTILFRHLDLDNTLNVNGSFHAASSVGECAGICSADSDCISLAFTPGDSTCIIYEKLPSATDSLSVLTSVIVFGVCPTGFSVVGRRCIRVVTDKLDWDSAKDHCRLNNADLITLESQAKIGEFRDFMVTNGHGSDGLHYWIGASDVNEGWQWTNGMTFSSISDLWCDGQPVSSTKKCVSTKGPAFNCLYNLLCYRSRKFVCEIEL